MAVGAGLALLNDAVLQQVGKPGEVFTHPANTFLGGFIGSSR
jgi:multiple sugar transport system ATP-binding protein